MDRLEEYTVPHLEWEAIAYPVEISRLTFSMPGITFDPQAIITVYRGANAELKARLTGRIIDPRTTDEPEMIGKGNIIRQGTITGFDAQGNTIKLDGCVLGGYQTNNYTHNDQGFLVNMVILLDSLSIQYHAAADDPLHPIAHHYEWFLLESIRPHFWGATTRSLKSWPHKARIGIDEFDRENTGFYGRSIAKDYFQLITEDWKCIIAEVPKECTPTGLRGLCLEFRGQDIVKANKKLIKSLRHFLSFMLGTELYPVGHSKLVNYRLSESFADNPGLPGKLRAALPPIQYNSQYDWGNFALQVNKLFPRYQILQANLSFNHAIDRFWIAATVPVGVNLPVLAGAMEIIAGEYLKMTGNDQLEYLSKNEYEILIGNELKTIRQKMTEVNGGEIMFNKIAGAFRKGPNEKINLFFSLLGLPIGKAEKEAINLRNKMTHGKRDYANDENVYDDIVHTRVYQVLFNRIVLMLLEFDGYYIDYSTNGCPSSPLTQQSTKA